MSQENVDRVREALAAYNRSDFDAAVELFDPEIDWVLPPTMEAESCHGPDEIKRLWRGVEETFEWDPLESTCRHASLSIL